MLPIKLQTGDPIKAWEAGLAWVFLQSVVLFIGSFFGNWIRRVTPRAALLATLTGIAIAYISIRPALQMFQTPIIGLTCFAVIMLSWFGGVKFRRGLPAGFIVLMGGTALAWGANLFDLNYGGMSVSGLVASFTYFGFSIPLPAFGHTFSGFEYIGLLIVTAIPVGICDLIEALDNVESASAVEDKFSTRQVLITDGMVSMIGGLMGNPYNLAVYIGHPGGRPWEGAAGMRLLRLHGIGAVLAGYNFGITRLDSGRRDSTHPALYWHADRLPGFSGNSSSSRSRGDSGSHAPSRSLGGRFDQEFLAGRRGDGSDSGDGRSDGRKRGGYWRR